MRDDVVRMFDGGLSVVAIADATGLPKLSVLAVLVRAGKEVEPEDTSEVLRKEVRRRYEIFETLGKTMEELGINKRQYWRILAEDGVPIRQRPEKVWAKDRRDAEVVNLYQKGEMVNNICALCAINRTTLYRILRQRGLGPDRDAPGKPRRELKGPRVL